jgi:hypothetical protein
MAKTPDIPEAEVKNSTVLVMHLNK